MSAHPRPAGRRTLLAALAAAAVTGSLLALPASASPPAEGHVHGTPAAGALRDSYLVLLKGDERIRAADRGRTLAERYGGTFRRGFDSAVNGFSAGGLSESEARRLAADPAVDKVVHNQRVHATATQQDPPSWGLDRIDQSETAPDGAYSYPDTAGEGVTAYVLDTGIRIGHRDFEGRASYGYDAVDGDMSADDGNGHGTHVAGTLAGALHGVAKKAELVAVRVLDDNGAGSTEQVIAGIDWITAHHQGPSVANMSLGGSADEALDAAVRASIAAGITYGVAAGNENTDAGANSPARVAEALTVASSTKADRRRPSSNYGPSVDLFAPGEEIVSDWNTDDGASATLSGTSMATPHVVGAAALHLAAHPDATPAQVAAALTEGATPDRIGDPGEGTPNRLLRVGEQEAGSPPGRG
ncbi:S8 family peptidase [Streptomyces sp. SCSIO ZS0520]|uniref:S8 family peptidase n=1 Tax=Streptomyces sp. SCSIO ZS0520 TaxID=2892996 RepID=UPI0021D917D6|nr:S8 family peptidase [Streptomyces sp. SCSIO ZS0520]